MRTYFSDSRAQCLAMHHERLLTGTSTLTRENANILVEIMSQLEKRTRWGIVPDEIMQMLKNGVDPKCDRTTSDNVLLAGST